MSRDDFETTIKAIYDMFVNRYHKMSKVVIIGGGAAGMIAAYSAALTSNKVILLERMKSGKRFILQERADAI